MKIVSIISIFLVSISCITFSQTVTIGKQVWMTKNLDVSMFRNGDPIPEAKTEEEWTKAGEEGRPIWCKNPFDSTDQKEHGKLYNWYAVNDPRGLAPRGWKIPSEADWNHLIIFLGGQSSAAVKMKSTEGWFENGGGTNESGFTGLPSGYRSDLYEGGVGAYYSVGELGGWWCSSKIEATDYGDAHYLQLYYNDVDAALKLCFKADGFPVRCLRD